MKNKKIEQIRKLLNELEKKEKKREIINFGFDIIDTSTCDTIIINNKEWTLNNLDISYEDFNLKVGDNFGFWQEKDNQYFNWITANIVANQISGWRLPTREEFEELDEELGDDFEKVMKTEELGFYEPNKGVKGYEEGYLFWTSTVENSEDAFCFSDISLSTYKNYGLNIRLIRERN